MLYHFNTEKQRVQLNPHLEFKTAITEHADQVYRKDPTNINQVIQTHPDLRKWKDQSLSGSRIWEGEKLKGKAPQIFTHPIVVCAVIEDSIVKTSYGETYNRVSIQPSWITGELVIVKEETHVDEHERKMIFLGREVDIREAKALLITAILSDIASGSEKAKRLIPKSKLQEARKYLENHFEKLFFKERPAFFHVQHGVIGSEDTPFETWDLVRLTQSDPKEAEKYQQLCEKIRSSVSSKLYDETLKHFENRRELTY